VRRSPTAYDALCLGVPFINPILGVRAISHLFIYLYHPRTYSCAQWDKNKPTDKTRWNSQHNTLKALDPPYVYNVFKNDKEGFVNAVVQATSTPIERYVCVDSSFSSLGISHFDYFVSRFIKLTRHFCSFVLPAMRMSAVEARLAVILETDWRAEAAELLADRKASRVGEVWGVIHISSITLKQLDRLLADLLALTLNRLQRKISDACMIMCCKRKCGARRRRLCICGAVLNLLPAHR
jgi:hypothetical protein